MKYIIYIFLFAVGPMIHAQHGYRHLDIGYGTTFDQETTIVHAALEFNSGDYDSWELFIEAQLGDRNIIEVPTPLSRTGEIQNISSKHYKAGNTITTENRAIDQAQREEIFVGGAMYEPLLVKHKNFLFHFRGGVFLGTASQNFTMGSGAGLEVSYSLPGSFILFLQQNNRYLINIDKRFRHGVSVGVKISI